MASPADLPVSAASAFFWASRSASACAFMASASRRRISPRLGGRFLFCDFIRVGALFGWTYQGSVFVLVGFADGLCRRFFFCGCGGAVAVVLRGYLQAVDEDPGTARVDAVGGQRQDYIREGELDGVGVFEGPQVVDGVLWRDVGFVGFVFRRGALAGVAVKVAEVLVFQRG